MTKDICSTERRVIRCSYLGVPPSIYKFGNDIQPSGTDIDLMLIVKEKLKLDHVDFVFQISFAKIVEGVQKTESKKN